MSARLRPCGRLARSAAAPLVGASLLLLAGCHPQDALPGPHEARWRDMVWPEAGIRYRIPCKPQATQREVPLAGAAATIQMQGCEHRGVLYAVAFASVAQPERIGTALAHWREASVSGMRIEVPAGQPTRPGQPGLPFLPPGALDMPQSLRLNGIGHGTGPVEALHIAAAWFAGLQGGQARAYTAIVYSAAPLQTQADTFLEGIALL